MAYFLARLRHRRALIVLGPILLSLVVYGRALTFPFFSDDFFQMPFLHRHTLAELWQTAAGLFFFRPLAFTLWKGLHALFGFNPLPFHAANLALHALNIGLVGHLTAGLWARRGERDWKRGGLAALLFALYPFSYESAAWVAAVMHPLVVALILLSITGYRKWRAGGGRFWLAFSLFMAAAAPFAHENGVLVAPLLLLVAGTEADAAEGISVKAIWRAIYPVLLHFLALLPWLLLWSRIPAADGAGALALNEATVMGRNALYFLQGIAYPLTWAGGWLRDATPLDKFLIAGLLGVVALGTAVFLQGRAGFWRRRLLPWGWTAVSLAPAVLFLPYLHVSAAPRMLTLAGVGIAWLWSDCALLLVASLSHHHARARRLLTLGGLVLLLALLMGQNTIFIRAQLALYARGGRAIREATAAATDAHAAGHRPVFINFPAWIAPERATYALGQEGDILVLDAAQMADVVWLHSGQRLPVGAVRYDDIRRDDLPYYTGPLGEGPDWASLRAEKARLFLTQYEVDTIQIETAGTFLAPAAAGAEPLARFAGVTLREATAVSGPRGATLTLTWTVAAPPAPDVTVFVHALAGGQLAAQGDGDPVAGTYPFWQWAPGTVVVEQRRLPIAAPQRVLLGLYHRGSGERLPILSGRGEVDGETAVVIPVQ